MKFAYLLPINAVITTNPTICIYRFSSYRSDHRTLRYSRSWELLVYKVAQQLMWAY